MSEFHFYYCCSGICIHSEMRFEDRPALEHCVCTQVLERLSCSAERQALFAPGSLADAESRAYFAGDGTRWLETHRTANELLIHVCEIAQYSWDAKRKRLLMYAYPGVDARSLEHFLFASVIPLIHSFEGRLLLHASAFADGEHAWICLGDSGSGKSSLAMQAQRRGFEVLSDDYILLERASQSMRVWKSEGSLRIRPDMHAHFFPSTTKVAETPELFAGKFQIQTDARPEDGTRPRSLKAMLFLSEQQESGTEVPKQEAFQRSIEQVFFGVAAVPERTDSLFAKVAALVSLVPCMYSSSKRASFLDELLGNTG